MSIATEISRIKSAKSAIAAAIAGKGVTVPDGTMLDGMAALIAGIEAGGGDTSVEDGLIERIITEYSNSRVTKIGNYVFNQYDTLTKADFPAATSIGSYAFNYCSKLKTANFPVATSIGASAFYACSTLTKADFPAVTSIGAYAFYYCSNLNALILRSETMCKLSNKNAFTYTPIKSGTGYIYVPSALLASYQAATNWSTFSAQFRAIEDYPDICGGNV